MRRVRHINGHRFMMRGMQVNKGVLEDAAEILNVPLNGRMYTSQIVDTIVNDSYGRPTGYEQLGIDFIVGFMESKLGEAEIPPHAQAALAWLKRQGKRPP